ncbi:DUF1194 domain-containing protein [Kiloniella sp.]|uniref:DUF1194 domain-containing protein n=1 Tax=Kiloniella sp. TaxID=1938587 RepID=UPI003B0244DB
MPKITTKKKIKFVFSFLMLALPCSLSTHAAAQLNVDLELILAIDCSYSVDQTEYTMQMEGIAYALRSPEIHDAVKIGKHQRIGITLVQWSNTSNQSVILPWSVIGSSASLEELATEIEQLPRAVPIGSTSISAVIAKSMHLFATSPFQSNRQVLDISGYGRNNDGVPPHFLRDVANSRGITINGLAITDEIPSLHYYFKKEVIGGYGSFVIKANSYSDYKRAMLEKLIREIGNLPIASNQHPWPTLK